MSDDAEEGNPNLVGCKDCHNLVSKNAEVCPHCGCRIKRSTTDQVAMVFLVLTIIGFFLAIFSGSGRR